MSDVTDGSLSDTEFQTFLALLRRFVEHDLDQFELWRFETMYGSVHVNMSRAPLPGVAPDSYRRMSPPPQARATDS
ncbi:hypothetical protein [Streptosporangium saharense]|uniref:Uncharacterized protein n=1 Tax=Streptosporangium saharense TaxID=1706840 RepID=A0A7W7VME8_9ACTN|nr:hypothetical protein [Streptosporangium saharense]MBB4915553.1 hypothetical protein [Streptosporangium saharense]